jgi:asparagine synthase (glutamine-hydrolysing)
LLPTFLLSRFAREHVKVALGGDGGDELLMGYPTFRADAAARVFRQLPAGLHRAARRQADRLPVRTRNFSWDFVVRSFVRGASCPDALRHPVWMASVAPGDGADPLHPELRREFPLERVLEPALSAYAAAPSRAHLQRLSYQYCKTYLAEDILHKIDRASMAVSLEARSPFLDRDLVEFIARLPVRWKLSPWGRSKVVLKRAFAHRLPRSTVRRQKRGFGIPVAEWLKGPLSELVADLLAPSRLATAGYFQPAVVARLLEEHRAGRRNHRKVLWTLLAFELWRERYRVAGR